MRKQAGFRLAMPALLLAVMVTWISWPERSAEKAPKPVLGESGRTKASADDRGLPLAVNSEDPMRVEVATPSESGSGTGTRRQTEDPTITAKVLTAGGAPLPGASVTTCVGGLTLHALTDAHGLAVTHLSGTDVKQSALVYASKNSARTRTVLVPPSEGSRHAVLSFEAPLVPVTIVFHDVCHVTIQLTTNDGVLALCHRWTPSDLRGMPLPYHCHDHVVPQGAYRCLVEVEGVAHTTEFSASEANNIIAVPRITRADPPVRVAVIEAVTGVPVKGVRFLDKQGVCIFRGDSPCVVPRRTLESSVLLFSPLHRMTPVPAIQSPMTIALELADRIPISVAFPEDQWLHGQMVTVEARPDYSEDFAFLAQQRCEPLITLTLPKNPIVIRVRQGTRVSNELRVPLTTDQPVVTLTAMLK